jgi:predicted lipid-binding transport protein (Tim44 family)
MILKRACSVSILIAALSIPVAAMANTAGSSAVQPAKRGPHLVQPLHLADVVVQQPSQPAPQAPPAPQPAPTATATTVQAPPARNAYVEQRQHSYMGTIAISALAGGLAGALVGGSLYFLADDQHHAARIGYWAAGGVLVGTTVGIIELAVEESRADRAVATHLPKDPAPTLRLALYQTRF